ncbi:GNAT family N-acetyltransferase [Antribacter sp. KLBMP9083]|uniref:GNAT family N-acetyltransferase n=1 Tax=Antribacter soli TaxID=2910976 RepID=A0AA41U6X3_9MICO|nr:GNAT family N-acetyltransferase [Antribacter soli]MCF4120735.1 GNAT family N-acetyltransferase [Antribacter soli]
MAFPSITGSPVRVRYTKWDGTPHWENDAVFLGTDEHGAWVGMPAGTRAARPGAAFTGVWDSVTLFPEAGWTATFNAWHPKATRIYVDLTDVPRWSATAVGHEVTMADLDLDVIERASRPAFIDDEDEFAEHQVRYGYPADLVATVRRDADSLLEQVREREAPFDGPTARRWLDRLLALDLPVPGLAARPDQNGMVVRELTLADEAQARAAQAEFDGWSFLFTHDGEAWPDHVARLARERRGLDVLSSRVPHTFLVGEADGELVGRLSVRHALNGGLRTVGGHIGYGVRPAFRGRGHATALLRAGLAVAAAQGIRRALLTCDDDNVPSARAIERCGGVLEAVVIAEGRRGRRYWVPTATATTP